MKWCILVLLCFQIVFGEINRTWWKHTTLYEVYLQSFKDSNGDGTGDLRGVTSKLDHFLELGIETVYISPPYLSPMEDGGYDVSNFTAINPMFGTMEDFDELVAETKKKVSSDKHPWFIDSINKIEPYTNFYVWKDAKGYTSEGKPIPPTNWISIFKGSAWQWNEQRKQFYLHQFSKCQPDLNFRNKALRREMKKTFKFWLDKGVSGFRLDATKYLIEDDLFRDEPLSSPNIKVPFEPRDVTRIYTSDLWESYQLLHEFREFCDRVTKKFEDYERIYLPEAYGGGKMLYQYYGKTDYKIAHFPLNFAFVMIDRLNNAAFYHNLINNYLKDMPEGATPCWNAENHDKLRKAMMFNAEYEYLFTTMVMLLPGVAYVYYGQEIGMVGSKIRVDQRIDKNADDFTQLTRDDSRSPMQWDDSLNAGFSNSLKTYLPVSSEHWRINVKTQRNQKNSHYHIFKKMMKLRKTDTLKYGDFKSYVLSQWVLAFTRTLQGRETYIVILNFGSETQIINLNGDIPNLPDFMIVETGSLNCGYISGQKVPTTSANFNNLLSRPLSTLVLSSNDA